MTLRIDVVLRRVKIAEGMISATGRRSRSGGTGLAVMDGRGDVDDYVLTHDGKAFKQRLPVPNGSAACRVAEGRLHGALYCGHHAYDVAAPALIVSEAGGKVTDIRGRALRFDDDVRGAVMSNRHLHDQLLELAREVQIT